MTAWLCVKGEWRKSSSLGYVLMYVLCVRETEEGRIWRDFLFSSTSSSPSLLGLLLLPPLSLSLLPICFLEGF